jgi:hypothetical protein
MQKVSTATCQRPLPWSIVHALERWVGMEEKKADFLTVDGQYFS